MNFSLHTSAASRREAGGIRHGPEGRLYRIWFDRTGRHNAISRDMWGQWADALHAANACPDTSVTVLQGRGEYFTSGSDLALFKDLQTDRQLTEEAAFVMGQVQRMIDEYIDHEKLLVSCVNGPCIGIGLTQLGLCDLSLASDSAYFYAPFGNVGYTAEGCSSYTFPRIMGHQLVST